MESSIQLKEVSLPQGDCIEVSNGTLQLTILISSGPRILSFGFVGQENEFCSDDPFTVDFGEEKWRIVGGHRLWHSPEVVRRTYYPDNNPVEWRVEENTVFLSDVLQPWVQVKKDFRISFLSDQNRVRVEHTLTNYNAWDIRLSAWSLSEMAQGGVGVVPFSTPEPDSMSGSGKLRSLQLWTYSRITDPRVTWLDRYAILRQVPGDTSEFKIGTNSDKGWLAYFNHGHLFIKRFNCAQGVEYPDYGCTCEAYIDANMLEMETLSPLTQLAPEASLTHVEEWELLDHVPSFPTDTTRAEEHIKTFIQQEEI